MRLVRMAAAIPAVVGGRSSEILPRFFAPAPTAVLPVFRVSADTVEGISRPRYARTATEHAARRHRRGNHVTPLSHRTVIERRERLNTHRCQDEIDGSILPRMAQPVATPSPISDAHSHHLRTVTSPDAGGVVTPGVGLTCSAIAISARQGGAGR